MDRVKINKYQKMHSIDSKYKKFMCANCDFFTEYQCSKHRVVVECAKKNLKNKA